MMFVPICKALSQTPMRTRTVLPSVRMITSLSGRHRWGGSPQRLLHHHHFHHHHHHRNPSNDHHDHRNSFLEWKADADEKQVGRGERRKKNICWALAHLINIIMLTHLIIIIIMIIVMMIVMMVMVKNIWILWNIFTIFEFSLSGWSTSTFP